ncbi:lipolytic enzyme [Plectosphaerella cucumerina]|uniref:Lipolytic enzyme n=1 Tax=Plectosphaerella cucumerina TaxID=40658 RepID=A0A8K0TVL1_9PEZI|nr:lipolytic enzyme [Plectosphaerella cucumerina]
MFGSQGGLGAAFVAFLALSTGLADARRSCPSEDHDWVTVWGSMPQLTEPHNLPPAPFNESGRVFRDTTIRQTVKVSLGASKLRLQLSNAFGGSDLPITGVSVALPENPSQAGGSTIQASTAQTVTFSGSQSFIVPKGAAFVSDPIDIEVEAESILAISIYSASGQLTNDITSHPGSRTSSWLVHGDHIDDAELQNATRSDHWFLINSLQAPFPKEERAAAIAIVGDSLTDGRGSTTNANNRWPDRLLARLQDNPSTSRTAILNQAAGGNRVLADGLGPNGASRIDRDVLAHPGAHCALLFIGINDIGTTAPTEAAQSEIGDRLVQAYGQMATRLRARGVTVFGATLTPASGPGQDYGHPEREVTRRAVNEWIRGSTIFDAIVDFDKITRDPEDESRLRTEYDDGDHLHLNPTGYQAMADGIDLEIFEKCK